MQADPYTKESGGKSQSIFRTVQLYVSRVLQLEQIAARYV
jgi:hypothetical protein